MRKDDVGVTTPSEITTQSTGANAPAQLSSTVKRRSFLKSLGAAGAVLSASPLLIAETATEEGSGTLTKGDAAILRFLVAAEIIESDLWLPYAELGGVQDNEVSALASKLIPGYPAQPTGGSIPYTQDLQTLDLEMPQYVHDNTEDELTHEVFINARQKLYSGEEPESVFFGDSGLGRLRSREQTCAAAAPFPNQTSPHNRSLTNPRLRPKIPQRWLHHLN